MTGGGSVVVRRQLGFRLRQLRVRAGKSLADVKESGVASESKINRMENGKLPVKIGDVWALCRLYGVDQATTDALAALAPGTQQDDWWERYASVVVPDWLGLYVGLEESAAELRAFDPVLIHGLLQTEDYARAVIGSEETLDRRVVDQRVQFRIDRQTRVLARSPRLSIVLGAGALSLVVGSPEVMTAQVRHLRDMAARGTAEISVLPWTAGAYPMVGGFTLLAFAGNEDPRIAYVEFSMGARYVEQPAQVDEYERVFALLLSKSIPIGEWKP